LFERLDAKSQIVSTVGAARKDWQKGGKHVKAFSTCGWFDKLNKLNANRQIDGWTCNSDRLIERRCLGNGNRNGGQRWATQTTFELQSSELDGDTFRNASTDMC